MNVRGVRWLIALLLGIFFGVVLADSASAAPTAASPVAAYIYDGHHHSVERTHDATERGPPAVAYDCTAPLFTGDHESCGASARPWPAGNLTYNDYDHTVQVVQVASGPGTTGMTSGAREVGSRVRSGARCAAKYGDDVADVAGDVCKVNSFTGDTPVLMADGTTKPIKDVTLGDKVMATDPETGETGPRKVVDLIRHDGLHTMVAVRLSDGSTIDATDQHPFWVESSRAWVYAIDLEPGDIVVTAGGQELGVVGLGISAADLTAYNLTVSGLHTYFVGDDHVLVHNCRRPTSAVRQAADEAATDADGVLRCQACGTELITRSGAPNSREFDHIFPFSRGGGRDIDNIWDLCRTCNRQKGARTLDEWGWP